MEGNRSDAELAEFLASAEDIVAFVVVEMGREGAYLDAVKSVRADLLENAENWSVVKTAGG